MYLFYIFNCLGESATIHQGHNLLVNAATRVWDLMYVSKKPALEEVFKTSFGQNTTPPLESVRPNIYDSASKIWFNYIDSETKGTFARIPAWEFHSQLQSRIQKVTGGFAGRLGRLTSMGSSSTTSNPSSTDSKAKKEEVVRVDLSTLPQRVVDEATDHHISIVKDVVEQHYRSRCQIDQHMLMYIEEEWASIESMLTQERGIWGPYNESVSKNNIKGRYIEA